MQRRGEELRRNIVLAAKLAFLEHGFDRTSMDDVAARAQTSKRSLYAYYPSKDDLFLAVVEAVRELSLDQLGDPHSTGNPATSAADYCARFLQLVVWEPQIATCRLSIGEAVRNPRVAHEYFERIFQEALRRLAQHLQGAAALSHSEAAVAAYDMVALTVLPRLIRTLLGVEPPIQGTDPPTTSTLKTDVDTVTIRRNVAQVLHSVGRVHQ